MVRGLLGQCTDSLFMVHELSCSVMCGNLVPWPGIEPITPALQSRFFPTGPPGKSLKRDGFTVS